MAGTEARFASKVDGWYFVLMAGTLAVGGLAGVPAVRDGKWWGFVVLAAPFGLATWNLLSTYYVVGAETLSVHCLLFHQSIPLSSVTTLRASRDFRSAPALSLDRLEVRTGAGSVLVSPDDKDAFVEAIRSRQPSVSVEL